MNAELQHMCEGVEASHPGLALPREEYLAYLAARAPAGVALEEAAGRLHTGDLYLALACVKGIPAALQMLEAGPLQEVRRSLRALVRDESLLEDICQNLRVGLLTASSGARGPRLLEYSGHGPLLHWLRAVAFRDARRSVVREQPLDANVVLEAVLTAPATVDPTLAIMRAQYRTAFSDAFREALGALSAQEKLVLKMHLFEQLSQRDIARFFEVHEASVSRWLTSIREQLMLHTRRGLETLLGVSRADVDSLLRLLGSSLDASWSRIDENLIGSK